MTLNVHPNAVDGQTDRVTLTAKSVTTREETTKTAIVYVQKEQIYDANQPWVWTTWKSTCQGAWDSSNCNTNTWTVEWAISDRESGMLADMFSDFCLECSSNYHQYFLISRSFSCYDTSKGSTI